MNRKCLWLLLPMLALLGGATDTPTREAVDQVREGIRQFKQGDLDAADKAFEAAETLHPNDPRIAFDRGCVAAKKGAREAATGYYQTAALARDVNLATRGHYNLGCLVADEARELFGEKPIEATPEQRKQGVELLTRAVSHYRDCLGLDRNHADARHNLELIRLWIKQMQALWDERDRQKTRDEMDLLQFLAMLQERQDGIHASARPLVDEPPSPLRRQAIDELATTQRTLAEEIDPLKEKIESALQPQPPAGQAGAGQPGAGQAATQPPVPVADDEELERARRLLLNLADGAGQSMATSAERLSSSELNQARESQRQVVEQLDEIFLAVVPFNALVQKAIQSEQKLIESSQAILSEQSAIASNESDAADQAVGANAAAPANTSEDPQETVVEDRQPSDSDATQQASADTVSTDDVGTALTALDAETPFADEDDSRMQSRITRWSEVLPLKAQAELQQLPPDAEPASPAETPASPPEVEESDVDDKDTPTKTPPEKPTDAAETAETEVSPEEQARLQMEAQKAGLRKAIELSPRITELSDEASGLLSRHDRTSALPKQEEALRLLKEIAAKLPKQDERQQGNQEQDSQDQQQDDQRDQKNEDQQQQQNQPEQKRDSEQEQSKDESSKQEKQEPRDLSREQAESVLRRVRERERKHRELERELQRYLVVPGKVDKDW